MYHPPDYIDNITADRQLGEVLNRLLGEWGERQLDIASGFFEPQVWNLLGHALTGLSSFRLLLGRPPEITNPNPDAGIIDLTRFYRDKLRTDLEDLPLNRDYAHLIDELIGFLNRDSVAVRFYRGEFLHAKAYLMPNAAIVGSSNFTPSGMTRKAELNLVQQTKAVINDLRENWFEAMWANSADHKADLIDTLSESKFSGATWKPHDVFIKVLYEYFRERILPEAPENRLGVELASFQQEGLREAIRLIDRHSGVIVSDAVGLGKTYIGMGLLEHYVLGKRRKGVIPRGLVVCPAQLRDLVWEPKLNEYGIRCDVVSQEALGRADFDWKKYNGYDVVLVDESHNFRNPGTGRYSNLLRLVSTGKRDKIVILMTATPINNSIWDLYHQIGFITRGQDEFFRDYGIRNLKSFFMAIEDGGVDIFTLLEQVMVRRSRQDVKQRQQAGEEIRLPGKGVISFPERTLHSVAYDLDAAYQGFYDKIVQLIETLELVSFDVERFRKGAETDETKKVRQSSEALIGILKTLYLKRLESSLTAFRISIARQRRFQERFYDMLLKDRLLDPTSNRKLLALEAQDDTSVIDDETTAEMDAIIAALDEIDTLEYDLKAVRRAVDTDIKTLDRMLEMVELVQHMPDTSQRDAKLAEVQRLLGGELRDRKTLVFSYYHDTAAYVYRALTADMVWAAGWSRPPVIALINGSTRPDQREKIVRRFAPAANTPPGESPPISASEPEIDILISTDVLSEGQNLQDAGVIVNYDLHWTPIRMIQRAGRIDRLGTPFEQLAIYNCFPQKGLEDLLRLVERLQDRIRQIDSTVGLDASVLGEVIGTRSLDQLRKLRLGDMSVMDELERENELVSTDEMKFPLMLYLQQVGLDRIQAIPRGIGTGMGKTTPPRPSGVFFAFQAGDRHYWRLNTADGEVITDKRRLFRYLQTLPGEPRQMPPGFEVFDALEKAAQSVLSEINSAIRGQRVPQKMGSINLELNTALNQMSLQSAEEGAAMPQEAMLERVRGVLRLEPLDAFKRDKTLKSIREQYKSTGDQARLAEALDEFFVTNDLYRDVAVPKTTLEQISEEKLHLIAYEVFS
jgi:superfamily II DNA or RNA helicase